ncbi:protoporphyrinogen oxidase [Bacillus infantis]|uniref:protoporphyrinogen oxidase n=1 Tax=Bacillus infantis TaxID=324767 RepID=UPI003019B955
MKTAVVIGGGITGLSAMYYLQKLKREKNLPLNLILAEKGGELGGKIATVKRGEYIMETGADSVVARNESILQLLDELKLHEEVVYNATGTSYLYSKNRLVKIPEDTVFGIPTSVQSLFSSPLISFKGKVRALKDLVSKNKEFTKDSSIGLFLESFLGRELVEYQVSPVLSGVYSGKLNELTMATTLPYLLEYKNKYGSIIRGLSENKKKFQSSGSKKFISFKGGLSALIDRLEEALTEAEILKGAAVEKIEKHGGQYTIAFSNRESITADYVILSTPHDAAEKLLRDDRLDPAFAELKNSSLTSIYLGFDIPDSELPADGTGFIVSEGSDLKCNACTWTSRKWSHTSERHQLLLRLFYKSSNPNYAYLNGLDRDGFVEEALNDVKKSLGISGQPAMVEVTRWNNLMPNYSLKHGEAVESLTDSLTEHYPNVLIAGCSYYGVGIAACIANGQKTAEMIAEKI